MALVPVGNVGGQGDNPFGFEAGVFVDRVSGGSDTPVQTSDGAGGEIALLAGALLVVLVTFLVFRK